MIHPNESLLGFYAGFDPAVGCGCVMGILLSLVQYRLQNIMMAIFLEKRHHDSNNKL
jgi:hypothetical protein